MPQVDSSLQEKVINQSYEKIMQNPDLNQVNSIESKDSVPKSKTFNQFGVWAANENQPYKAFKFFQESEHFVNSKTTPEFNLELHNNLGNILMQLEQKSEAVYHYHKALNYADQLDQNDIALFSTYSGLANAYTFLSDQKKCLSYYQKAHQIAAVNQNEELVALTLFNRSVYELNLGNFHSTDSLLNIVIDYQTESNQTFEVLISQQLLAYSKTQQGSFSDARSLLYSGYRECQKLNFKFGEGLYLQGLVWLDLSEENVQSASEHLEKLTVLQGDNPPPPFLVELLDLKVELYRLEGDFEKAYSTKTRLEHLKDSIFTSEQSNQLAQAYTMYETDSYINAYQGLKHSSKVQETKYQSEISTQRLWIFIFISLTISMSLVGLLYYSRYRNKRQLAELKTTLFSEMSHRTKNHLQLLSNMIYLGKREVKDEKALSILEESADRITVLGVIHRNFEQKEHHTHLESSTYLSKLVNDLLTVNSFSQVPQLRVEFESKEITSQQAINIGIILNELICNSCKYGFTENDSPEIVIKTSVNRNQKPFLELNFSDNGKGFEEEQLSTGYGIQLIDNLVQQMNGFFEYTGKKGFYALIKIPVKH